MKKSIRKIGASLLAIGITAAGINSIPASAAIVIDKNIQFSYTNIVCPTYVAFTPQKSYWAETYSSNARHIKHRKVYSRARHKQGWLDGADGYSYSLTAYSGFSNIPSNIHVITFYSEHYATYYASPSSYYGEERAVTYTI